MTDSRLREPCKTCGSFQHETANHVGKTEVMLSGVWSNVTEVENNIGFALQYDKEGFGFGELIFRQYANGKIIIETETMGRAFVREILEALVDKAVLDNENDGERHE